MPAPKAPLAPLAERAKRDPALLKHVLANPNLRYKLPTSMLTVAQRRARTNAQAAKESASTAAALADPSRPLSGVNLTNVAKGIVDGQYAPAYGELDRRGQEVTGRETQSLKRTGGIYDTINKYQAAAMARQNASQAAGAAATAGIATGAMGQVDAAAEQQRAQAARDSQIRGDGLDGGAMDALAARVAASKDSITQRGQIAGNALAADAQTNNAVLGGIGAATQQRGGEQANGIRAEASNALSELAGKRLDLKQDQGAKTNETLLKLRQQATDEYYTSAGLGLKQNEATAAATAAAGEVNKYGYTNAEWAAKTPAQRTAVIKERAKDGRTPPADHSGDVTDSTHGYTKKEWQSFSAEKRRSIIAKDKKAGKTGGDKSKSPWAPQAAQSAAADSIGEALDWVKRLKKKGYSQSVIRQYLLNGVPADKKAGTTAVPEIKKAWLNVAMDIAFLGGISKANVDMLHLQRGIKVKALGYKTLGTPKTIASGSGTAGAGAGASASVG
jgi:hypothetical protein